MCAALVPCANVILLVAACRAIVTQGGSSCTLIDFELKLGGGGRTSSLDYLDYICGH